VKEIFKELSHASGKEESGKLRTFLQLIIDSLKEHIRELLFPTGDKTKFFTFNVTKAVLFEWKLKTSSEALVEFKREYIGLITCKCKKCNKCKECKNRSKLNDIGELKEKVENGIKRLNEMIEELQNN